MMAYLSRVMQMSNLNISGQAAPPDSRPAHAGTPAGADTWTEVLESTVETVAPPAPGPDRADRNFSVKSSEGTDAPVVAVEGYTDAPRQGDGTASVPALTRPARQSKRAEPEVHEEHPVAEHFASGTEIPRALDTTGSRAIRSESGTPLVPTARSPAGIRRLSEPAAPQVGGRTSRVNSPAPSGPPAETFVETDIVRDRPEERRFPGRQGPRRTESRTPTPDGAERSRQQVYAQARQWVAQDATSHPAIKDTRVSWEQFERSPEHRPAAAVRPGPVPGEHVVSEKQQDLFLSIGQIDITVEAPQEPLRSKERVPVSSASGRAGEATSSRLRRHYLRIP